MTEHPIRVVIVDDEALVRGGFHAIVSHQDDIDVVGDAADGASAITVCAQRNPDVVLMDLRMPGIDGIEATRRIARPDGPRVLILTTFDLDEHVYAALTSGASGFLTKDTPPERLADAVRAIARGDTLLSPSVTRRLVEAFTRMPPLTTSTPPRVAALTARELDVLREIARGDSCDRLGEVEAARPRLAARRHQIRPGL